MSIGIVLPSSLMVSPKVSQMEATSTNHLAIVNQFGLDISIPSIFVSLSPMSFIVSYFSYLRKYWDEYFSRMDPMLSQMSFNYVSPMNSSYPIPIRLSGYSLPRESVSSWCFGDLDEGNVLYNLWLTPVHLVFYSFQGGLGQFFISDHFMKGRGRKSHITLANEKSHEEMVVGR